MSATEEAENGRRHNVAVVGGGRGVGEMLTVGKSTVKGGASIDIITRFSLFFNALKDQNYRQDYSQARKHLLKLISNR